MILARSQVSPGRRRPGLLPDWKEGHMPERKTIKRARQDAREGKAPTTQAGEFVREEIHHVREGKHGARSTRQAIAIGLSKARRAGVKLPKPPKGRGRSASRPSPTPTKSTKRPAAKRSRAVIKALKREGRSAASRKALSRHARSSARKRSASQRSAAAKKAARTKGPVKRSVAAKKAARTRGRRS
jgi:hypothetical protein